MRICILKEILFCIASAYNARTAAYNSAYTFTGLSREMAYRAFSTICESQVVSKIELSDGDCGIGLEATK